MAENVMSEGEEKVLKDKSLKISIAEGSAYSAMDGFGLKYIIPYALALGASSTIIGFLSSVPSLLGSLSQLFSPKLMEKTSRKRMLFFSVLTQALLWLPLVGIGALYFFYGLSTATASVLLVIVYSLLIIAGTFSLPAWNSWMRDLISDGKPATYFGRRSRINGIVGLVAMLVGALILDYYSDRDLFLGFAILFALAFVARVVTAWLFTREYEPKVKYESGYYFTCIDFAKRMPFNNYGRFVLYTSLVSFGVAIASPFFVVYMLEDLGFNYVQYTIITLSSIAATLIFLPYWGRFSDRYGQIHVLRICGYLIPLVPLFWLLSSLVPEGVLIPYLFVIELFSGLVWAGFNLSTGTFTNVAVTKQRMGICVAYSNIINAIGAFAGAILGGILASIESDIFGLESILFVFLLSFLVRFLVSYIMIGKLQEPRPVDKLKWDIEDMVKKVNPINLWKHVGIRRTGFGEGHLNHS